MNLFKQWLFIIFAFATLCLGFAQANEYNIGKLNEAVVIDRVLLLPAQLAGDYDVEDISYSSKTRWLKPTENQESFDLYKNKTWLQFTLSNDTYQPKPVYLTLTNHFQMSKVAFYSQIKNLKIKPLKTELSQANFYYSTLVVAPSSKIKIFVQVTSDNKLSNSIVAFDQNSFAKHIAGKEFYHGVAVGGMVLLAIAFWILFFAIGEKSVGILAAYFTVRGIFLAALLGGNLFYWLDGNPEVRGFEIPFLVSVSSFFYVWFASTLFNLKVTSPFLYKLTRAVRWSTLAYIPLGFLVSIDTNLLLSAIVMCAVMLYLIGVGIVLVRRQKKLALLYTIVVILHFLFTIAVAMGGYFQFEFFGAREPLHMSSFWLNALLMLFLFSRLYHYQLQDKQRLQLEALEHAVASKEAKENLLRIQEESQDELEQRVQERTLELNIALNELEELNHELERKNTSDELTGLHNRRFYDQKILAEFRRSKRNLTPLSVILLDVDHFKRVNDTFGHLAGDQCLAWVGQVIKQNIKRSTDMACRYGGEEFVLILPDTEQAGAIALAELIREEIKAFEFVYQKHHIPLTMSCGVSTYIQQDEAAPEDIFLAADQALYQAKQHGRDQVQYLDINIEKNAQE